jgi:methylenetetrahydrofolate reductase (NADPH)
MKITDIWKMRETPTLSFELFPARSEKAAMNLEKAINKLATLNPDFVSVTFGAGGSTREGSRQLLEKLKLEMGLQVIAYFACYGLSPEDIEDVLNSYQTLGIESILAVRGDTPHDESFKPHPDSLAYASDLVAFISPKYDFCIGVAAYPEGHIDSPNLEKDIEHLKYKIDQGAEYIITNYFYDNRFFFDFLERCQSVGIDVPIIPGVMPIYSVKMMERLAALCGATITEEIYQGIATLQEDDKEGLLEFGIEFAYQQCVSLIEAGIPGLHIYTMDRSKSTVGIINRLRESDLL